MKLRINKLLKNSTILSIPGILSILLSLISIPIHLNIVGVENYGNYIIFHFLLIISSVLNFGIGKSIAVSINNYPKKSKEVGYEGVKYTIIRPSALYGERCISSRVGQIFLEKSLNNEQITVNGDGTDKLDFTYINDLMMGVYKIIKSRNSINQIFNITYGNSRKIQEVLNLVKKNFLNTKVKYVKRDKLVPKRGTLSIVKAKKLLGYKSMFPLEKGFSRYIEWYKSKKKLFNKSSD